MIRKRNNNQGGGGRRHGGGGGNRRFNNGGGGNQGGGNRDHQNIARQKHHATQMREKYMNHARDAQINGDRVDVEYYLQHVDHYNRVLAEIAAIESERQEKFREQQQQQQAQSGEQPGGDDAAGGDDAEGGNGASEEPISQSNQPRMTRGPRPQRHQRNEQPDNGAKAANANTEEIPLPGSALTAV